MKIVRVDNFARETVADSLVAVGITNASEAETMVTALQASCDPSGPIWYQLKPDDYMLSRGMEDFV